MNKAIWHISDTHTYHGLLDIPDSIDIVIHSGDATNPRDPCKNKIEMENFIEWYSSLPIPHKIFVAGNHDISIERNFIKKVDFEQKGIIYLENDWIKINEITIWGSPITPTFGQGWAFNKDRSKTHDVWKNIPNNTDVIVTHGPPKGMLDLSYDRSNKLEMCGDVALSKRVIDINPKLCLFGHVHNCKDIINAGIKQLSIRNTIYSNGSVVTDGKFGKLSSNGNLLKI